MRLVAGTAAIDDVDTFVAALGEIGEEHGAVVQPFDARYVAGREHLRRAREYADRAFERDENVARDRGMETLLYAAGRRQIEDALTMGVEEGEPPVVVVVDVVESDSEGVDGADEREAAAAAAVADRLDEGRIIDADEELPGGDPDHIREFFDIGDDELAATDADLEALVCERVALLTVEK